MDILDEVFTFNWWFDEKCVIYQNWIPSLIIYSVPMNIATVAIHNRKTNQFSQIESLPTEIFY